MTVQERHTTQEGTASLLQCLFQTALSEQNTQSGLFVLVDQILNKEAPNQQRIAMVERLLCEVGNIHIRVHPPTAVHTEQFCVSMLFQAEQLVQHPSENTPKISQSAEFLSNSLASLSKELSQEADSKLLTEKIETNPEVCTAVTRFFQAWQRFTCLFLQERAYQIRKRLEQN